MASLLRGNFKIRRDMVTRTRLNTVAYYITIIIKDLTRAVTIIKLFKRC